MTLALFQVLEQLGSTLPDALSVERWPGGLCNRLYRITSADDQFALRVNHPDAEHLGVDREREKQILLSLADQPWCPRALAVNEHWLLTPWMPGAPPKAGDQADLAWLAEALSAVQAVEVPGPVLNIADQIRHLSHYAEHLEANFIAAVEQRCRDYQLPDRLTLTHHDWHPGNLMIDGADWVLLDWEFAALGDPAMDLAALCSGFELSDDQSRQLAEVMEIQPPRLAQAKALMAALAVVWYRANPSLAPADAPTSSGWLERWG